MSEAIEFDSDGRIKRFPGEPLWSTKLPEITEPAEQVPESPESLVPESIAAQAKILEQIVQRMLQGDIKSFFVYTDNANGSCSVYYTPTEDVFSTYGAIQAYAQRYLQKHIEKNSK